MKLSNEQLNDLRVIISGLISLDKTNKKEIAYDDIDNYINRALAFAGLEIDKEDRDSLLRK